MMEQPASGARGFAALPKVELHCHLDGSVPVAAFLEMAANGAGAAARFFPRGVDTPEEDVRKLVQAPARCKNLAEYLACFGPVLAMLSDMDNLYLAARALVCELAKEHVVYAELRFAPLSLTGGGAGCAAVTRTVLEALRDAGREFGVRTGAILCMMRHESEADNRALLALAHSLLGQGVAGVDLAGDEAAWPVELYAALFRQAADMGLPFTVHAGETPGSAENVRRALDMGAVRIGHGIAAATDAALVRRLAESGAVLEMCPVSNLQTGAAADMASYPFGAFVEAGVRVSVNTDNRTVSNTALSREWDALAARHGFIDAAFVKACSLDALAAAFLPEGEKKALAVEIEAGYAAPATL